jgi:hypothetical protein
VEITVCFNKYNFKGQSELSELTAIQLKLGLYGLLSVTVTWKESQAFGLV